jgi:hypothetical protein
MRTRYRYGGLVALDQTSVPGVIATGLPAAHVTYTGPLNLRAAKLLPAPCGLSIRLDRILR